MKTLPTPSTSYLKMLIGNSLTLALQIESATECAAKIAETQAYPITSASIREQSVQQILAMTGVTQTQPPQYCLHGPTNGASRGAVETVDLPVML